jgi:hypothetical protein
MLREEQGRPCLAPAVRERAVGPCAACASRLCLGLCARRTRPHTLARPLPFNGTLRFSARRASQLLFAPDLPCVIIIYIASVAEIELMLRGYNMHRASRYETVSSKRDGWEM